MRTKITKLVYVGIACFCMVSVLGQEKVSSIRMPRKMAPVRNETKLRASGKQQPDSVVEYYDDGYKVNPYCSLCTSNQEKLAKNQ